MKRELRNEKVCLNCGTRVNERFCPFCGQENVVLKESFGHHIGHFFNDLTHYDSKLLVTLKTLILRPGILPKEYLSGKRLRYLHPIRLYVFISFLYFPFALSMNNPEHRMEEAMVQKTSSDTKLQVIDSLQAMLSEGNPRTANKKIKDSVVKGIISKLKDGSLQGKAPLDYVVIGNITYRELIIYDSSQRSLPIEKKEKGLKSWLYHRWLTSIDHYGKGFIVVVGGKTSHFVPKMMFFLLPLFALLMKLFYDRKKYFYVDHLIFSLHFHSAVFLVFLLTGLLALLPVPFAPYFITTGILWAFIYLVIAMRNTYQQSFIIAFLKSIALTVCYSVFILLGYAVVSLSILL